MTVRRAADGYDHLLAAICAMLAVVAIGNGAARPQMGFLLAAMIGVGSLASHLVARRVTIIGRSNFDVMVYVLVTIGSIAVAGYLDESIGIEGYPRELWIVPVLSWMLAFGSFVAWRDTTLNFQLVPCIAIFGLATAWEEDLGPATALFCVFLVCAAALFFRAHTRSMVVQAEASGIGAEEAVRSGVWRWMAGPGWALGSAMGVLLVTSLVAPLLRISVGGAVGEFAINLPNAPTQANRADVFGARQNIVRVGSGPNTMRGLPVLRVRSESAAFFRGRAYADYTGSGWRSSPLGMVHFVESIDQDPSEFGIELNPEPFAVEIVGGIHDQVYVPGLIIRLTVQGVHISRGREGAIIASRPLARGDRYSGIAQVQHSGPTTLPSRFPPRTDPALARTFFATSALPRRVVDFVRDATEGGTNDWDKLDRLRRAIASQARYNLRAPAVPLNQDVVDAFLFEVREGYCDLFATAMVIGARLAGFPARYVNGFLVDPTQRDARGTILVRDSDYHAWAEVYFLGLGWVPFDATEGAQEVPGGGRRGTFEMQVPWWREAWVQAALDGLLGLAVAGVVIIGLWGLAPKGTDWRTALRLTLAWLKPPRGRAAVERLFVLYHRDLKRRVRRPRRLGQTPDEYVDRFERELGDAAAEARDLNRAFAEALFAPTEPDRAHTGDLAVRVKRFRKIRS